jgi:hypothetical protein
MSFVVFDSVAMVETKTRLRRGQKAVVANPNTRHEQMGILVVLIEPSGHSMITGDMVMARRFSPKICWHVLPTMKVRMHSCYEYTTDVVGGLAILSIVRVATFLLAHRLLLRTLVAEEVFHFLFVLYRPGF